MNINLFDHISYWIDKTDDECIELASNEFGINAEQALINIFERDFCREVSTKIINNLNEII